MLNLVWSIDNVVINEVELNPVGNDNYSSVNEWIELYNPTDISMDISGSKISTTHGGETHTFAILQGTVLNAKSYYVFERGSQWLDNNDESVILRNNADTIVDETPELSDEENDSRSWQRRPDGEDNWVFRSSTKAMSNGMDENPEPEPTPEPTEPEPTEPEPTEPEPTEPEPTEPEAPSQDIITVYVDDVIDGDTFDTSEGYRIRLADVDAPEIGETGYLESAEYLELLVEDKTVTLDIDSISGTDPYGRYVCLVYVEYNSTHSLNVNQALVDGGYVVVDNYTNNEFEPIDWTLYIQTEDIPEFPSLTLLLFMLTFVAVAGAIYKKTKNI
jgi:endonuclease YncB( thermonuclease family)